ncbi:MAG TPA: YDG/SRA domain-containing protein [Actinoplanes sp.]|nr:YDG/SRA domain-containing protein [Actinoplanes sp.]
MAGRTYGEITGFPPGSTFVNRRDLAKSGVHRPLQDGICGGKDGAESVVVSGGYEDDDDGHEIIYTGFGGRGDAKGNYVAHQQLIRGNAGLARNSVEGRLVRVIRGARRRCGALAVEGPPL